MCKLPNIGKKSRFLLTFMSCYVIIKMNQIKRKRGFRGFCIEIFDKEFIMNYKIRKGVLKKYKDEKDVTEIFVPDNVGIIGEGAFDGCTSLVRILLPETVQVISDMAFNGCENLKCIALPDSTLRLGWYAFKGCHNLSDLTLPSTLKEIGRHAFAGCDSLSAVNVMHESRIYKFVLSSELDDERWQEIRHSLHRIGKAIAV